MTVAEMSQSQVAVLGTVLGPLLLDDVNELNNVVFTAGSRKLVSSLTELLNGNEMFVRHDSSMSSEKPYVTSLLIDKMYRFQQS